MATTPKSKGLLLLETSVLISFLKILRLDILGLLDRDLVITEEVDAEIKGAKYPFQRQHLNSHLELGTVRIVQLEELATVNLKSQMLALGAFGTGECSSAAKALELDCVVAMTDLDAIKAFQRKYPDLKVCSVLDLMCELVCDGQLSVADADLILPSWAKEAQNPVPTLVNSFVECLDAGS